MSICDYGQEKLRPQTSPKGEQSKQLSENSERPPEVTHSGYARSQNTILLQTAKVGLSNPNSTSNSVVARLIFDVGSVITEKLFETNCSREVEFRNL